MIYASPSNLAISKKTRIRHALESLRSKVDIKTIENRV